MRAASWRRRRIWFPSPAEVRFIRLMGGVVVTVPWLHRGGFPLAVVVSLGRILRSEHYQREVRVGSKYVDFGNDVNRAIEIDGADYHRDIVAETQRDEYLASYGWQVMHIRADQLYRNPDRLLQKVRMYVQH